MHFISFSSKYSLPYVIIHVTVGNVLLMWAFIPKDFSLTRTDCKHQDTSPWWKIPLDFACTLLFQRKNPDAACPDGMAARAARLLLYFTAPRCRRSFSIPPRPPPCEAAEDEVLGEGNVGEESLPIPSPQCRGREGISVGTP